MNWITWLVVGFFTVFGLQAQQQNAAPDLSGGVPRDWLGLGGASGGDGGMSPIAALLSTIQAPAAGGRTAASADALATAGYAGSVTAFSTLIGRPQTASTALIAPGGAQPAPRTSFIYGRGAVPTSALAAAAAAATPISGPVPLGKRSSGAKSF